LEHVDDEGAAGDDEDEDGLTRFEEYRGFVAELQHIRTSPDERDAFYYSNVPLANAGVGHVSTLPVRLHRIILSEVSEQRVINWTITTQILEEHFDQHAVLIFDGGLQFLEGGDTAAFGWVWCPTGDLCVPSTVGDGFLVPILDRQRNVQVLTGLIGLASPEGDDAYGEDPADTYIVNTVAAHELGHSIHVDHAVPPRVSIMVGALSDQEPWFITWYDLPSQFDMQDIAQIQLKP
jgi:hypothetical protein